MLPKQDLIETLITQHIHVLRHKILQVWQIGLKYLTSILWLEILM